MNILVKTLILASRSNYFNHIELNDNPYGHDN